MYDFIRLLQDYNIDSKSVVTGWVQINCPFHANGQRGYKGGFNLSSGYYNCWNCGNKTLEEIFSALLNVSTYEANKILKEYSTDTIARNHINKKVSKSKYIELPGESINEGDRFWLYIKKRNFNPSTIINNYSINSGGIVGYWSFRIIIPIFYRKRLVSFQGRSIFSKSKCEELSILRYITNSVENSLIDPKHICYNLDNCTKDYVVLVEGVFDCWRLGPNNVCSTFGTSISQQQINLLAKQFKKIILLFDNEYEAQKRAKKYGLQLSALGVEVEIFNPEFIHDPGDYNLLEEKFVRKELGLV